MKVKVIKSFIDKYTDETHLEGQTFECTEDRYDEILRVGPFVEKVEEEKPKTKAKKPKNTTEE